MELLALNGSRKHRLLHLELPLHGLGLLQPNGTQQPQQATLLQTRPF